MITSRYCSRSIEQHEAHLFICGLYTMHHIPSEVRRLASDET